MVGGLALLNGLPLAGAVQRVEAFDPALRPDRTLTERFNADWSDLTNDWDPSSITDTMTGNANFSTFTGPDGDTWAKNIFQEGTYGSTGSPVHKKTIIMQLDATGYTKAYFEYQLRLLDGFDYVMGGKLGGLWAGTTSSASGGSGSTTSNTGLLAATWRHMFSGLNAGGSADDDTIFTYCYDRERYDAAGAGVSGEGWNHTKALRSGRVMKVGQYIDLGTAGNSDGTLQMWLDDVLLAEQTDRKFLDAASTILIEGFWFDLFWGGGDSNWATVRDEEIHIGRCIFEAN